MPFNVSVPAHRVTLGFAAGRPVDEVASPGYPTPAAAPYCFYMLPSNHRFPRGYYGPWVWGTLCQCQLAWLEFVNEHTRYPEPVPRTAPVPRDWCICPCRACADVRRYNDSRPDPPTFWAGDREEFDFDSDQWRDSLGNTPINSRGTSPEHSSSSSAANGQCAHAHPNTATYRTHHPPQQPSTAANVYTHYTSSKGSLTTNPCPCVQDYLDAAREMIRTAKNVTQPLAKLALVKVTYVAEIESFETDTDDMLAELTTKVNQGDEYALWHWCARVTTRCYDLVIRTLSSHLPLSVSTLSVQRADWATATVIELRNKHGDAKPYQALATVWKRTFATEVAQALTEATKAGLDLAQQEALTQTLRAISDSRFNAGMPGHDSRKRPASDNLQRARLPQPIFAWSTANRGCARNLKYVLGIDKSACDGACSRSHELPPREVLADGGYPDGIPKQG